MGTIQNNIQGKIGEWKVKRKLHPLIFGKVEHRYIGNLILIDDHGKSHQIDHVEIRHNGIFCIETKNYSGWIFGDESSSNWTQVIYQEKHKFLNPLKQNKSHIYQINQVLKNRFKVNSLVVMVQNNADRIDVPNVINLKKLKKYLKRYNDGTNLTTEQMDYIYFELINAHSHMSNRQHVKNIKQTQKDINHGICPRCGGRLVERVNKNGQTFIGCSNYPNCRFIKKD